MSEAVFPTLPGVYVEERVPFFSTSIGSSGTGVEYRVAERTVGYRFVLRVAFLRPEHAEHTALFDFFIARQGRLDSFWFPDPVDEINRRVRFDDDELQLKKGRDAVWSGSIELVTVT